MTQEPPNIPPTLQPEEPDWRTARREARQERRATRSDAWIPGLVLIVVGLVFLLQNLAGYRLQNWWALFILIPAISSFVSARNIYAHNGGRFTRAVRGPLIGGFFLAMISAAFLINLDFRIVLPLFMILGGVALMVNWFLPE